MATRSTIGIENEDGTIDAIYCHWDGYLEGVGKILKESYNSEQKIRELLSYGNVSSLDDNVKSTIFYERDRQETDQKSTKIETQNQRKNFNEEYNYVWIKGEWFYSKRDDSELKKL